MEEFVTAVVCEDAGAETWGNEDGIMIIPMKTILQTVSSKCNFNSLLSL